MRADFLLSILLSTIFAGALLLTLGYRWQVALAPSLASGMGLGLMMIHLAKLTLGHTQKSHDEPFQVQELAKAGWFLLAVFCVITAGFGVGGGAFVFAYNLAHQEKRKKILKALCCSVPVPLVVFFLFQNVLRIQLFPGLLFE